MGHCIYFRNGKCTNKRECPWADSRDPELCGTKGILEADKLTIKPKLRRQGIKSLPGGLQL